MCVYSAERDASTAQFIRDELLAILQARAFTVQFLKEELDFD